jgi:glucans biosynthesis protein
MPMTQHHPSSELIWIATALCAALAACTASTPPLASPAAASVTRYEPTKGGDPAAAVVPRTPAYFQGLVERVRAADPIITRSLDVVLPESLRDLDYDAHRSIRFRTERSLWRGQPGRFEVQFLHPGTGLPKLIRVYELRGETPRPFPFSVHLFTYGALEPPASGAGLGFTGLRVHAPINRPDYRDEVIVFSGASYFRSLGRHQSYGLSARALAVDLGEPTAEEFPAFTEMYLVAPAAQDESLWVLAALSSPHTRGAYAFHIQPGDTTIIDVEAHVWIEPPLTSLGFAPLSSMFLFGEEAPASLGDFRPEVHDSDVMVSVSREGEQRVRPLRNPTRTVRSDLRLDSPRGFGLLQRDRDFASYQDLECHYQKRPSVWVQPLGDWGPGTLRLLEITTLRETDDNIALAWLPASLPQGEQVLRYRLHFGAKLPPDGARNQVIATRVGKTPRGARFVVDFRGPDLADVDGLRPDVVAEGATILEAQVIPGLPDGAVRLSFEAVSTDASRDVELRGRLRRGQQAVTETWSYRWQANP